VDLTVGVTPKVLDVGDVDQGGALPSGTVTFLFTDIEGSTPLWDAHPAAMREALARHDEIVRKAIDAADGHIFSTGGDGFGAVFQRAGNAVAASVGAQRDLNAEPWPEQVPLRVRMGVHTGEVQERDGDYFGPPVNRAARIMGAANGRQIVVSDLTAGLTADSAGFDLVDLGQVQLKGVVEAIHVFGVDAEGADWIDRPLVSTQTSAGNLPIPQTELFTDLVVLQERVSALAEARLVTLTGSGGVGKTRAAVEIGWLVVDEFVDGIWLVELAAVADPDMVLAALASTMSIQPQPGMTMVDSIVDWCLGRRMLLIIDNCEHVLEPVVEIVTAIVAGCPTVTIIATSREPLGIDGERVNRIPSLDESFAVELFCDRALAADSKFTTSGDDSDVIAAICNRVDGIPLAIELAAARIRSLSPQNLLDRLDDRFRLLRGGGRGGLERHQTLRAAVAWSYQLLSGREQILFDRVSVFAGGFDLAAAEAVTAGEDIDEYDVVDLIGELVDKSMVIAERDGATVRYRLLETLRQYAEERLDDRGETSAARDRHLTYYGDIAEGVEELFNSPRQLEADELTDMDWDNFRAAHEWAVTTNDFGRASSLLGGLMSCAQSQMRHEFLNWIASTLELGEAEGCADGFIYGQASSWALLNGELEQALDFAQRGIETGGNDERAMALAQTGRLYGLAGCDRHDDAAALVPEVRQLISRTNTPAARFWLWHGVIDLAWGSADTEDDITEFLAVCDELGGPVSLAEGQRYLGNMLFLAKEPPDIDGAIAAFERAITLADTSSSINTGSWARFGVAAVTALGHRDEAPVALRDAIEFANDARAALVLINSIESEVTYLVAKARLEPAAVLLGHLELRPASFAVVARYREDHLAAVAHLPDVDALKARGAAMTRQEIVDFALAQLDEP
jgi:predicted ATPase/class 3 adenylate cyclase